MDRLLALKKYFLKNEKVALAFLFGSQAKKRTVAESDFDIAVWLEGDYGQNDVNRIWGDLEDILKKEVDLVILNQASTTIAGAAVRGVPLLVRNYKFYLDYMIEVSGEAEDFQDFIIDLWRLKEKYGKVS